MFSLTRAMSVTSTRVRLARCRLRFALFDASKCRRPDLFRSTFPVAVTLKRFATAFFVLRLAIGLGIKSRESNCSRRLGNEKVRLKEKLNPAATRTDDATRLPHGCEPALIKARHGPFHTLYGDAKNFFHHFPL